MAALRRIWYPLLGRRTSDRQRLIIANIAMYQTFAQISGNTECFLVEGSPEASSVANTSGLKYNAQNLYE
jgi:hypothetical protein